MPSSNKTPALGLNQWLGTDKPKKDDFNADNLLVDGIVDGLRSRISALEEAPGGGGEGQALEELQAHVENQTLHITPAEREAWSQGGGDQMVMGTYKGDGTNTLKVTMGFRPRMGFLFKTGAGINEVNWTDGEIRYYTGFFSEVGCSRYIALDNDGITLNHTVNTSMTGNSYKYNDSGATYAYVAWK